MVKPVSPDDLPQMRGVDGLKGSSPLGVEPKGEGVEGQSGYKISGQQEAVPSRVEEPKTKTVDSSKQTSATGVVSSVRNSRSELPIARAVTMDLNPSAVRPW
jgi:hypothetical protein